ncbi:MAG: tetratricopeptide repeat protein [Kiritimatiellae bacterium]|nr:tetratricopeptide repeat protein [Kiritimatiellia bacterium]
MFSFRPWLRLLLAAVAAGAVAARAAESEPAVPSAPADLADPAVPAAPAASVAPAESPRITRGLKAMEDELYTVAERQFRSAVDLAFGEGERTASAVWLARSLIAQGRSAEALQLLNTFTQAPDAAAADVPYWRSRAAYESGDAEQALRILREEGAIRGEDRLALQARALVRAGKPREALAVFEEFEARHPASPMLSSMMLERADALLSLGSAAESVGVLRRLLQRFPRDAAASAARLLLGQALMLDGHWKEAEQELRAFANDSAHSTPDRAQALLILASGYERVPDLPAAQAALDSAVLLARGTRWATRANLSRARMYISTGKLDEGRRLLRDVAAVERTDPQVGETQLLLGGRLLDAGDAAAAASEYQFYLDTFTDPAGAARARMGRGWALLRLDRPAEAAGEFERAAPGFHDPVEQNTAWMKAADAYFASEANEAARAIYLKLAADAGYAEAVVAAFQAAECLRRLGQHAAARGEYTALMDHWPEHPLAGRAALRLAAEHEAEQRWADAVGVYSNALVRFPAPEIQAKARLGWGLIRYLMGEFSEARRDFEEIIRTGETGPIVEQAFFMRGWCAFLQGREEEAVQICRDFVERYPESQFAPDVLFWLAERAYNRGSFEEAEQGFVRLADGAALAGGRLAPEGLFWAGRAAMRAREFVRAREHFRRLLQDYPGHARVPDARFAQGDALSELGLFSDAILAFQEVIRSNPDSHLADLAWGRKGDCHFALGTEDARRYREAWQAYKNLLDQPRASPELRMQAEFKMGRCEERSGRITEALDHFMNVIYSHVEAREQGGSGAPMWFARAAFSAAEIFERREEPESALRVYTRLVEDGTAAAEAENRIERIRKNMGLKF